jgi:hypothetical protein
VRKKRLALALVVVVLVVVVLNFVLPYVGGGHGIAPRS